MRTLDIISEILIIIGALNWGLIGLFQFDLVAAIFGGQDGALSRVIYTLVGLAGLYKIIQWRAVYDRRCQQIHPQHA